MVEEAEAFFQLCLSEALTKSAGMAMFLHFFTVSVFV